MYLKNDNVFRQNKILAGSGSLFSSSAIYNTQIFNMLKVEQRVVRIAAFHSVNLNWMPEIKKRFHKLYPNTDLKIYEGDYEDITNWFFEGLIDIGFISEEFCEDKDLFTPLHRDSFVCIAPKKFTPLNKDFITLDEIKSMSFIAKSEIYKDDISSWIERNKIKPSSMYKIKDNLSVISMVEKGLGISVLPELEIKNINANVNVYPLEKYEYRTIGIKTTTKKYLNTTLRNMISVINEYIEANGLNNI